MKLLAEYLVRRSTTALEAHFATAAIVMSTLVIIAGSTGVAVGVAVGALLTRRMSRDTQLVIWRLVQIGGVVVCAGFFAVFIRGIFVGRLPAFSYVIGALVILAVGCTLIEPVRSWMRANFWKNVGR